MSRPLSRAMLALALILVAVALMLLSLGGYLQPVKGFFLGPFSTVQRWVTMRYNAVHDFFTSPRDIASLQARVSELEAENAQLQQQMVILREQLAETEALAALLDYARTQPESSYLAADVVGRDISPFLRWALIGAGSDQGLQRGMPVVTAAGLVGRLVDVYATVSRVQLITDPAAAVNVKLQSSRAEGVLAAQLNGELRLDLIDPDIEVKPDELVLTSGLGGSYPPDIPVGRVVSIRKRDYELFQQAVLEPAVDFENIEIMLVITNFRRLPLVEPTSP